MSSVTDLHHVRSLINPGVLGQKPYRVGSGDDIEVKVNQNENPFDWPPEFKQRFVDRLLSVPWNRYPDDQPDRLIAALARFTGCERESIIVGNGSNELTMSLGTALVQKGTRVLLPHPMFSLYEKMVLIQQGEILHVDPHDDFGFDATVILDTIRREKPDLTVICSPNNPTGRALPKETLLEMVEAATGFVLVDEAYVEFVGDGRGLAGYQREYPNLVLMRTFSKALGLAGLRIGYLIGHPEVVQEMMKARLPFMIDRLAEEIALEVLEEAETVRKWVRQIVDETKNLSRKLAELEGVTVLDTDANFVLFKTRFTSSDLVQKLAAGGVLIRDMSGYPVLKGYVRVSAGTPDENVRFLDTLANVLKTRE